jgi:hypothetical protein
MLVVTSVACSEQELPITKLYASNNCGFTEMQIKQVASSAELSRLFAALPYHFPEKPHTPPAINFTQDMVFLYALGQKPNNGYRIEQHEDFALIKNSTLLLPIRSEQPNPSQLYGQMITTPCYLFSLPKQPFSKILTTP